MNARRDPTQRHAGWNRRLKIALLTIPLLQVAQTRTCLDIGTQSLIDGFFDAVTPYIIDDFDQHVRDQLDLAPAGTP